MNIAFFSTQSYDKEYFNRFNQSNQLHFYEAQLNEQTINLVNNCGAVCAFVNDKLNESVIDQLHQQNVKLIAMRCAGYNNVDMKAAKAKGIKVVRVPAYSPHAVAEHAVALMMALNRKTHKAYNRVREGNFSLERLTGFDLYGKTVGVVGTGKIGEAFCHIMLGFGCRVMAYDVVANADLVSKGVQYIPLKELFPQCDVLSLHCPLNDATRHLINEESVKLLKKGSMLINTSRGGLIDTNAIIQALKRGTPGYLGIDVYEQEEKLFFHDLSEEIIEDDQIMRLMSFPNVLITAHQGFFTDEALTQIAQTTLKNIADFESGKPLVNEVV